MILILDIELIIKLKMIVSKMQKRSLSSLNKTVCILANSKSSDVVGAKIMRELKSVSGQDDFNFIGYGG